MDGRTALQGDGALTSAPSRRTSWADFLRGGSLDMVRKRTDDEQPPTVPPPPRRAVIETVDEGKRLSGPRVGS